MEPARVERGSGDRPRQQDQEDRKALDPDDEEDRRREPAPLERERGVPDQCDAEQERPERTDRPEDVACQPRVEPDADCDERDDDTCCVQRHDRRSLLRCLVLGRSATEREEVDRPAERLEQEADRDQAEILEMLRVDELEHGGAHSREPEQRQWQRGEHRRRARPAERCPRGIGDAAHVADRIAERHDCNEDRAQSQQASPTDTCAREQPGHCDQRDAADKGSAQRKVASRSALQQEQAPGRRGDHEAQQQRQRRAREHLLPVGADPTPDDVVDLVGSDRPEQKDREERHEHDLHA